MTSEVCVLFMWEVLSSGCVLSAKNKLYLYGVCVFVSNIIQVYKMPEHKVAMSLGPPAKHVYF